MSADVVIEDQGTIFLVELVSEAARAWVQENVVGDNTWLSPTVLMVEHRYVADIVSGMREAGLQVTDEE